MGRRMVIASFKATDIYDLNNIVNSWLQTKAREDIVDIKFESTDMWYMAHIIYEETT